MTALNTAVYKLANTHLYLIDVIAWNNTDEDRVVLLFDLW